MIIIPTAMMEMTLTIANIAQKEFGHNFGTLNIWSSDTHKNMEH